MTLLIPEAKRQQCEMYGRLITANKC